MNENRISFRIALCGVAMLALLPALAATASARQRAAQAWFGISLQCSNCRSTESAEGTSWEFSSPPEIVAVEAGSPADRAGLRAGDVLTHIDGLALITRAGAERMASVQPGQSTRWTWLRGGRAGTAAMVAAARTLAQPAAADTPQPAPPRVTSPRDDAPVRFDGAFAGSKITVRGAPNTMVLVAERECWLEIRGTDVTVRIAASTGCSQRAR
jgi:hypothetical protein